MNCQAIQKSGASVAPMLVGVRVHYYPGDLPGRCVRRFVLRMTRYRQTNTAIALKGFHEQF
jgi:hypothetical protein